MRRNDDYLSEQGASMITTGTGVFFMPRSDLSVNFWTGELELRLVVKEVPKPTTMVKNLTKEEGENYAKP